jgi:hypothetical protein
MRRTPALAAALIALGLAAAGCRAPEDPGTRYLRFARAAREGEAGTAWALLSTASQQQLEARSKALGEGGAPAGVTLDPRQLLLGDLAPTAPKVKSVKVVRDAGDEAALDVELEGGAHGQVTLRREQDGWRVVLPGG